MKKTFYLGTLAVDKFSQNSPEENSTCAEEDEKKKRKRTS